MRIRRALATASVLSIVLAAISGCGGGSGLFRQYEYEEDMYLSLDGSATVYVNSSLAALNALRGTAFDAVPKTGVDRDGVRRYFTSPNTRVNGRVTTSRRSNRQFVHVRVDVDDVNRLGETAPFAWSRYDFGRSGELYVYRQTIGAAAGKPVAAAGWTGRELIAFRLHLPSKIDYHNTPGHAVGRGNILAWEQLLSDRLRSIPVLPEQEPLEARMETQSILYRTLLLFGSTFVAVAFTFAAVIWWVLRRSPKAVEV